MKKSIILIAFLAALSSLAAAQDYFTARLTYDDNVTTVNHEGYTTCYSHTNLTPTWVGWELLAEETWGEYSRSDEFTCDPDLTGKQATTYDYSRSGYDRGHMAPAADMKWSQKAMLESFYMTNVCPQDRVLNAGLWLKLERKCRHWAKNYGKVWIITGPVYSEEQNKTIGREHKVQVPSAFYKTVLKQHTDGTFEAVSFIIQNTCLDENNDLKKYIVSLGELENITGLTFFVNLSENDSNHIHSGYNTKYWKW